MITYDEAKCQANISMHGIDFAELSGFFDGVIVTREDVREAYGEFRFQSVDWCTGEMLFVVWTPSVDEWSHIISARKAEEYERKA